MGSIARIVVFAKSLRHYYVAIALLAVVVALLDLAPPFLSKIATDEIVKEGQGQPSSSTVVIMAVVGMLIAGVFTALASNVAGYFGDVMAAKLRKLLSTKYFEHLMSLPQRYFDNELTGTVINRLNRSIANATEFMQMFSNMLMSWLLTTIFMLGRSSSTRWQLGLMVFAVYPIYLFLTLQTSKSWMKYEKEKNFHADVASGRFAEAVSQVKVAKSFRAGGVRTPVLQPALQQYVDQTYPQVPALAHPGRLPPAGDGGGVLRHLAVPDLPDVSGPFRHRQMVMLLQYIVGMRFPLRRCRSSSTRPSRRLRAARTSSRYGRKPESDDEPGKPDPS